MAFTGCAHLLLTMSILLLLCHRRTRAFPLPSPSASSSAASPSPPPVPALPRGLPRLIPVWTSLPVNPFTAKAAFIRYWNRKVSSNRPHPAFLFAKLSPLSAPDAATFSNLASAGKLASRIHDFCDAASLLCPSTPAASWSASSTSMDGAAGVASSGGGSGAASAAPFKDYENGNFSSYGNSGGGGSDQFAIYSSGKSGPVDSFKRYGKGSLGRNDSFANYEEGANVGTSTFNSYTTGATGGAGEFAGYAGQTNTVAVAFATYDSVGNGRTHEFTAYSQDANSGVQSFTGYGKTANGAGESFETYGNNSNTVASGFINYGEKSNGFNDTFTSYGLVGNAPENTFRSYASGSNAGVDQFKAYRDEANVGDDSFMSYANNANGAAADFDSYGKSTNPGSVAFKGYGQGSNPNHRIGFKHYAGENTTFKAYSNEGVEFKEYQNMSKMEVSKAAAAAPGRRLPAWSPEPGKFFRERDLMMGNRMPMPDIADKMPRRAFLPRDIATKIPFEENAVSALFGAPPGTAMRQVVASTVAECARPPSPGETKRCTTSAEDMLDFAVEMLGSNIAVRSTESTAGSGRDVRLGKITGIAGGSVTRSVSCHQSLFPYLVYYCHSVPRVRLYEADILDVDSNRKINHGVAICHLETSDWSPNHGAFVALGGKPGQIEVCHWIFEGDMAWTLVD
ncbi:BURP domain-containing protein 14-like precursor [Zea mays]|uniref:BURP8 n=1 Tax=Zea mays TaxID=4577 RepID=A0A096SFW2_MAIZE|nr:BURP domain-containing protein 14-like precursor [Zea mays]AMR36681.1 BURP8 [Zea mays]ONM54305.1 Polygalacturonase 1 beta-like protein 3 [Zea mays]|eukprot:NP_001310332.1 BURP domain-containing protein 14-like precursor [Zea mays]